MKKWIIKNSNNETKKIHKNNLISKLLSGRGMNDEHMVDEFLHPDISKLYDPFLLKDMDAAVSRIDRAIKKGQKIAIYGDYDVDGITSTSILFIALKKLGVDATYYIPERLNEGYGINEKAITYLKSLQTELIITVDCGITSIKEVEYTKSLGMDIIITDHHECKDAIPETIVINPKRKDCIYPNKNLAGCGIAFKIVQALWITYNLSGVEEFLDIAAIGTIADIVDLRGENRIIVKNGIEKINNSQKCGIKALKLVSEIGDNINSYNISFQIAPRINAVGRLSDAKIAVELFTTNDYDKALQIAKFLDMENRQRQKIEEEILNDVMQMIKEKIDIRTDRVIILASSKWHNGVVGIVASKIVERFHRPVILLCIDNNDNTRCKGSGRSISGFNLFDSLCSCDDLLLKYGGHEMAAGVTLETKNVDEFRNRLNSFCNDIDPDIFLDKIYAEVETDTMNISMETAEALKLFEPYGNGNPSPLLYLKNIKILSMKGIGNKEQHLKMSFEKNGNVYNGIFFNGSEFLINKYNMVDIMYNLDINEWNNNKSIQLKLKDIRANFKWTKETLEGNYYKFIKLMLTTRDCEYNFDEINFIKKDMKFLLDFVYFNRGYILVSNINSIKEIELILQNFEINPNVNIGAKSQFIICPNVENIEFSDNEILIYDFLPGLYEYKHLADKAGGKVYNFYDSNSIESIEYFTKEIQIDEDLIGKFNKDLLNSEITGTIKELASKYNKNLYVIYRMLTLLREKNIADILIKNDIFKIRAKHLNVYHKIDFMEKDPFIEKLLKLKLKFISLLGEE